MSYVVAFVRFWYDFIIGDDWFVAAGIAVAIALTALIAHDDIAAWWLMPVAVIALLAASLVRAVRRG